jgi:hypothetical protein
MHEHYMRKKQTKKTQEIESAYELLKKIKEIKKDEKRLKEVLIEGELLFNNKIFSLFGQSRYERVIHEFILNFLENYSLSPLGDELARRIFEKCDFGKPGSGLTFLVDSEIKIHDARADIILSIPDRNWEIAIELKIDHIFTENQRKAYEKWMDEDKESREVLIIGMNVDNFYSLNWNDFAEMLKEIINESGRKSIMLTLKDNKNLFADFIEGLKGL